MHKIFIITYLLCLPHESYFFKWFNFDASAWNFCREDIKYIIAVLFSIKSEIVWFIGDYLKSDISQFVSSLKKFTNFVDFYFVDRLCWYVMEWLKIDFFTCDENISIDMVERENSSCENVIGLHCWLLWYTFYQAHVECSFVKPLNNHLIYFLLHIIVIFQSNGIVKEMDPILQILNLFICWFNLYYLLQIIDYFKWLRRAICWCSDHGYPRYDKLERLLICIFDDVLKTGIYLNDSYRYFIKGVFLLSDS